MALTMSNTNLHNKASQHRPLRGLDLKPAARLFGRCLLRYAKGYRMENIHKDDLKAILKNIGEDCFKSVNVRLPWFEYLSFHRVGDTLPRGKIFRKFKVIERKSSLRNYMNSDIKISCKNVPDTRVSDFLIKQVAIFKIATIQNFCDLNYLSCFDAVRFVDGDDEVPEYMKLSKINCPFGRAGSILKDDMHHHVPVYPDSYAQLYAKQNFQNRIVETWDNHKGAPRFHEAEKQLITSGKNKPGRMTVFWLITRMVDNQSYYLGIFPHGRDDGSDDIKILRACVGAERNLGILNA